MLTSGRKTNDLLNKYFQTNNKKELIAEFTKWATIERTKHLKKNPPKKKTKAQKKQQKVVEKKKEEVIKKVEEEVLKKVEKVREIKKEEAKKIAKAKADYIFKINDRVKILDGNTVGIIENIEKKTATINFGFLTTKTNVSKLELVEKAK